MKSMILESLHEPLKMADVALPTYEPEQVFIKVLTIGLNFADTLLMSGKYQEKPRLPFAPGMEVCGFIEKCGEKVLNFKRGQRIVAYVGFGGLAEFISVNQNLCFPVPDSIPDEKAASLMIAYGSTELALNYRAKLQKGETLLVLGASGGVGLSAVQIGKAMGAIVVAVARGKTKCLLAKSKGADAVLDSNKVDLKNEVKLLNQLDVVYDPVGGSQFNDVLSAAPPETRILPIGFASGKIPTVPANILMVKNITLIGFQIGAYKSFKPQTLKACFSRLLNMWSQNTIDPHISHIFSLEHSNQAIDLIKQRQSTGKVVIKLNN